MLSGEVYLGVLQLPIERVMSSITVLSGVDSNVILMTGDQEERGRFESATEMN